MCGKRWRRRKNRGTRLLCLKEVRSVGGILVAATLFVRGGVATMYTSTSMMRCESDLPKLPCVRVWEM